MKAYLKIPNKQSLLMAGDILFVLSAFSLAYFLRIVIYEGGFISSFWDRLSWLVPIAVFLHIITFYVFELYDIEIEKPNVAQLFWIIISVSLATCLIVIVSYIFPEHRIGRVLVSIHVPVLILGIFLWRMLFFSLISKANFKKNLVLIDFAGLNPKTVTEVQKGSILNYNWIGMVSDYKDNPGGVTLNGSACYLSLESLIEKKDIKTIVVSGNLTKTPELKTQLIDSKFKGVEILDFSTFHQKILSKVPVLNTRDTWVLFSNQDKSFQPFFYLKLKRVFDVAFALIGLVLSSPLFLSAVVGIKLTSKGPIFFTQERLGLNENYFTLIKFRTMMHNAEKYCGPKWSSEDDPRITKFGRFLRKSRVDEIPQLINVLKGEMSFVGPRPIRKHFVNMLAKEFPYYRLRFTVQPGVTGWAQVKGDYAGSKEGQLKKLEYDLFYIQNRSMFFDLFILLKTVQTVLFRRGQ